jgi:hypothetical protein
VIGEDIKKGRQWPTPFSATIALSAFNDFTEFVFQSAVPARLPTQANAPVGYLLMISLRPENESLMRSAASPNSPSGFSAQ